MARRRTAATLAAAAMLLTTAPAGATAPTGPALRWGPVVTLARLAPVSRPDVVVDAAGTTTVVWSASGTVTATRRPAGGRWGPHLTIGHGVSPEAGVDAHGTVTVAWTRQRAGFGPQVMATRRTVHGAWRTPVAMSAPVRSQGSTAHGAFLRDLAVGRSGAVVVSWLWGAEDSGAARVQARYRPAGAGWGRIATLSQVEANSPVCAVDAAGRAVVVYVVNGTAYAVRRPAGRWTAPRVIGRHVEPPQLAVGDAGDVVVVWSALLLDLGVFRPQAVTRPVGGPWSAPVTLDSAGPTEPVVGTGPGGTSTAAWARPDGSVVAARHARTGTWSAPRVVAPPGDRVVPQSPYLQVSVGRSGAVLLSWTRQRGDASTVGAAYRPAGHAWLAPHRVSPTTLRSSAARGVVRSGDRSVLVWRGWSPTGVGHLQLRRLHP